MAAVTSALGTALPPCTETAVAAGDFSDHGAGADRRRPTRAAIRPRTLLVGALDYRSIHSSGQRGPV
jgi:hypothetical protein